MWEEARLQRNSKNSNFDSYFLNWNSCVTCKHSTVHLLAHFTSINISHNINLLLLYSNYTKLKISKFNEWPVFEISTHSLPLSLATASERNVCFNAFRSCVPWVHAPVCRRVQPVRQEKGQEARQARETELVVQVVVGNSGKAGRGDGPRCCYSVHQKAVCTGYRVAQTELQEGESVRASDLLTCCTRLHTVRSVRVEFCDSLTFCTSSVSMFM